MESTIRRGGSSWFGRCGSLRRLGGLSATGFGGPATSDGGTRWSGRETAIARSRACGLPAPCPADSHICGGLRLASPGVAGRHAADGRCADGPSAAHGAFGGRGRRRTARTSGDGPGVVHRPRNITAASAVPTDADADVYCSGADHRPHANSAALSVPADADAFCPGVGHRPRDDPSASAVPADADALYPGVGHRPLEDTSAPTDPADADSFCPSVGHRPLANTAASAVSAVADTHGAATGKHAHETGVVPAVVVLGSGAAGAAAFGPGADGAPPGGLGRLRRRCRPPPAARALPGRCAGWSCP